MAGEVELRFYAELRDFVDHPDGQVVRRFQLSPSVKDLIESSGVPHTEVDLVLVDGEPVDLSHRIRDGDRVSVYPVFEAFDIEGVTRVRVKPLRNPRFLLDVHLGRLARYLRLLGFDSTYHPSWTDPELVEMSRRENRLLLSRDVELLKHGHLTHGYFVRDTDPRRQLLEVVDRCHLTGSIRPFTRCMVCNGLLQSVPKAVIEQDLPPRVRSRHDRFWRCDRCGKVYWRGSHVGPLEDLVRSARGL